MAGQFRHALINVMGRVHRGDHQDATRMPPGMAHCYWHAWDRTPFSTPPLGQNNQQLKANSVWTQLCFRRLFSTSPSINKIRRCCFLPCPPLDTDTVKQPARPFLFVFRFCLVLLAFFFILSASRHLPGYLTLLSPPAIHNLRLGCMI